MHPKLKKIESELVIKISQVGFKPSYKLNRFSHLCRPATVVTLSYFKIDENELHFAGLNMF